MNHIKFDTKFHLVSPNLCFFYNQPRDKTSELVNNCMYVQFAK